MAMLKPRGKGQPFKPEDRQRSLLDDTYVLADAMARNVMHDGSQLETSATRSVVHKPDERRGSRVLPDLNAEADSSFDMYFRPKHRQARSNWIETVAGRGF
jgi:hypothetical protein